MCHDGTHLPNDEAKLAEGRVKAQEYLATRDNEISKRATGKGTRAARTSKGTGSPGKSTRPRADSTNERTAQHIQNMHTRRSGLRSPKVPSWIKRGLDG